MTSTTELRPVTAAVSMVTSMAVIGAIDIFVVMLADLISVWQFLLVRAVLAVPLVLIAARLLGLSVWPKRWRSVAIRSALIAVSMFLYFGALGFMPIAMALAGLFTSPIFVLLISVFVLNERIGPWRVAAVAMGFAGILVVLGPSGQALGWTMAMPVMAGLIYASGAVATRALCDGESTLALLLGIYVAQAVLSAAALAGLAVWQPEVASGSNGFLLRGWVWPMQDALQIVALQVIGSIVGLGLLNHAYRLGEASHVAVFEYSVMVFGPVFAWLFLGQSVGLVQALGIGLITAAGCIIAWRSN